ncbi:hypothetical protein [Subtercola boreus]|uniref:Uncharacterized protein n=1 Tax=Subtercola boreus TaxID=120213 RepID=A0A3E0WFQ5_9MICO|nr:hypothetical protein [Subtercola boreus]RFA22500.1 hypothetical protein B7R24_02410 [Subtercola boreus]RFA23270.1 hypothetical protein B7R23_02400 [Subtercola boreus]RFA29078.1 hypothetical protein B7R25_02415 [Subtercola boreus]
MALRTRSRLTPPARAVTVAIVAAGALALGFGPASPAMADALSFQLFGGNPDFGFVKAGSVSIREFDLVNSGDDDITIDPAPITALVNPFSAGPLSFSKTTVIPHNGHATFRVTYSQPTSGVITKQTITLVATDQKDLTTESLSLDFTAESVPTDPAHFTVSSSAGAGSLDFGKVTAGTLSKQTVTVKVDGVYPIRFSDGTLNLTDIAGNQLTDVRVTASSFGSAGAVTNPGASATFELTYAPTATGTLSGTVKVSGFPVTGAAEQSAVNVLFPLAGTAAAAQPTTPPTTTAAPTPGVTGTPGATQTAGVIGRTGGSTGSAGRSLAETGLPAAGLVGLAGLLATGGLAAFATMRRRTAGRK